MAEVKATSNFFSEQFPAFRSNPSRFEERDGISAAVRARAFVFRLYFLVNCKFIVILCKTIRLLFESILYELFAQTPLGRQKSMRQLWSIGKQLKLH